MRINKTDGRPGHFYVHLFTTNTLRKNAIPSEVLYNKVQIRILQLLTVRKRVRRDLDSACACV